MGPTRSLAVASALGLLMAVACSSSGTDNTYSAVGPSGITAAVDAGIAVARGAPCASCTVAPDCTQGGCLHNDQSGETFCGKDCTSQADCPTNFQCVRVNGDATQQCVPAGGTCRSAPASAASGSGTRSDGGTVHDANSPRADTCDRGFMGSFCENGRIVGFDAGAPVANATLEQVRQFSLDAVNYIRSRTCLPSLRLDDCLSDIGTSALVANASLGVHGYFMQNCMNGAHGYGRACQCGWAQENYGAASGTNRTWKDGVMVPLCSMMTEPKGQGHRSNIESAEWTRMGVGVNYNATGANWYHEFGR